MMDIAPVWIQRVELRRSKRFLIAFEADVFHREMQREMHSMQKEGWQASVVG